MEFETHAMDAWTDDDRKAFGSRLAEARKRKGLSQVDVAAALGLNTKQAVSHWEVGRNTPSAEQLAMMASEYGASVEALLGGAAVWPFGPDIPASAVMMLPPELLAEARGMLKLLLAQSAKAEAAARKPDRAA